MPYLVFQPAGGWAVQIDQCSPPPRSTAVSPHMELKVAHRLWKTHFFEQMAKPNEFKPLWVDCEGMWNVTPLRMLVSNMVCPSGTLKPLASSFAVP